MIGTLVVDDDYRVADIHASVVAAQPGFTVCGRAHTAAQARAEIVRLRPDLVLLDLYLPDEHGLDLVTTLDPEHRPDILVITAARDVATVRRAMQLGTVNYLVKPFSLSHLRERLVAYQDLHQRLHALGTVTETDQEAVDRLYALRSPRPTPTTAELPKRHSAPTMNLITTVVRAAREDISAAEVAAEVGISRPTAQRYLTYLAEQGVVELRLRYGGPGRPEQRYRAATI
ncbi:MAG TPA: response regulator [Pseudonocardiaceae bacterium]|jgi:response regulator of citrate/malate metabolism|nr:response regulator [Pseudonocardiaceae bacterium]